MVKSCGSLYEFEIWSLFHWTVRRFLPHNVQQHTRIGIASSMLTQNGARHSKCAIFVCCFYFHLLEQHSNFVRHVSLRNHLFLCKFDFLIQYKRRNISKIDNSKIKTIPVQQPRIDRHARTQCANQSLHFCAPISIRYQSLRSVRCVCVYVCERLSELASVVSRLILNSQKRM